MRRRSRAPRIVLGADPLVDGPTALRPWRDTDVPGIVAACQDPDISRWTRVPWPYGTADARLFVIGRHDALRTASAAPFAIVSTRDDSLLLGSVALMGFDWDHARCEVGYWLSREARGAGHATRGVRLICGWGFEQLGIERIGLMAATGNPASQRVAERGGFEREAVLRSYLVGRDGRQDMVMFGLLANRQSS
jgi:RimJ/RimL family protein N-acetyltransferase